MLEKTLSVFETEEMVVGVIGRLRSDPYLDKFKIMAIQKETPTVYFRTFTKPPPTPISPMYWTPECTLRLATQVDIDHAAKLHSQGKCPCNCVCDQDLWIIDVRYCYTCGKGLGCM